VQVSGFRVQGSGFRERKVSLEVVEARWRCTAQLRKALRCVASEFTISGFWFLVSGFWFLVSSFDLQVSVLWYLLLDSSRARGEEGVSRS